MKYEISDYKLRKLWEESIRLEKIISELEKKLKTYNSVNSFKNIYRYESDWTSWEDIPDNHIYEIELPKDIPDNWLSTLNISLVTKTEEGFLEELINYATEYIEAYGASALETFWDFSYIIEYKEEEEKYYVVIRVSVEFYEDATDKPLFFKFILTMFNPSNYHEIRANKT